MKPTCPIENYPEISIIIPSYNQGQYLGETLNSIIEQTYKNWECIIVNDGSTDNTAPVAAHYAEIDPRIHCIEQKNLGVCAARNRGIKESTGQFIQFLDEDDLLEPYKLETHLAAIKSDQSSDMVYGEFWWFEDGNPEHRWTVPVNMPLSPIDSFIFRWEHKFLIPIHCFLFRRSCFDRWGDFDIRLPNHEDWDLHVRFSSQGAKYRMVEGFSALYRVHPGSATKDFALLHWGECLSMSKHIWNQRLSGKSRWFLMWTLWSQRTNYLINCIKEKRFRTALRYTFLPGYSRWSGVILPTVMIVLVVYRLLCAAIRRAPELLDLA